MTYIGWLRCMFSQLYHYFDLSPSPPPPQLPRSYTVHISSENSAICCSVNIGKWEILITDSLKVSNIYDFGFKFEPGFLTVYKEHFSPKYVETRRKLADS